MFDGEVKELKDIQVGDELMGDDNFVRKVNSLQFVKKPVYRVKYQKYLDTGYDGEVICADQAILPMIPNGNRSNNIDIHCDSSKNYVVNFVDQVVDRDNRILKVELKNKEFARPDEVLAFVDKQIPNFLFEPTVQQIVEMDVTTRDYFTLVRPLPPTRYTSAPTNVWNAAKQYIDQAKEVGLGEADLPWATGLFLSAGSGHGDIICYNLKELHKDVYKELKRIFEGLRSQVTYDEGEGEFVARLSNPIFKNFLAVFNLKEENKYDKTRLVENLHCESFSKIRGPFLAGVMDGSSDYGLSDANYGLECYIRGLPEGQTREQIAELARSCSLSVMEDDHGILTLAGGMLFKIKCINNPPKDIQGLVNLTRYLNEDGQDVLLGMPQKFCIEKLDEEAEVADLETNGRFLLADYTVVSV